MAGFHPELSSITGPEWWVTFIFPDPLFENYPSYDQGLIIFSLCPPHLGFNSTFLLLSGFS
jgi:hypothetical protein